MKLHIERLGWGGVMDLKLHRFVVRWATEPWSSGKWPHLDDVFGTYIEFCEIFHFGGQNRENSEKTLISCNWDNPNFCQFFEIFTTKIQNLIKSDNSVKNFTRIPLICATGRLQTRTDDKSAQLWKNTRALPPPSHYYLNMWLHMKASLVKA